MTTVRYGSYSHDADEVGVYIEKVSRYNRFREQISQTVTWHMAGVKLGTSQADLTTKLNALQRAYEFENRDLVMLDDSGAVSAHSMINAATWGGVKVVRPVGFPPGNPGGWRLFGEYTTYRSFTVSLQAEDRTRTDLLDYHESVRRIGTGGSALKYMGSISGPPQLQFPQLATTTMIIQSGYAIGDVTWPIPNSPLFPILEHAKKRVVEAQSPNEIVPGNTAGYKMIWRYVFESPTTPVVPGRVAVTTPRVITR